MKQEEDVMIMKAVWWAVEVSQTLLRQGGDPKIVLKRFSEESITTMVRNGIILAASETE